MEGLLSRVKLLEKDNWEGTQELEALTELIGIADETAQETPRTAVEHLRLLLKARNTPQMVPYVKELEALIARDSMPQVHAQPAAMKTASEDVCDFSGVAFWLLTPFRSKIGFRQALIDELTSMQDSVLQVATSLGDEDIVAICPSGLPSNSEECITYARQLADALRHSQMKVAACVDDRKVCVVLLHRRVLRTVFSLLHLSLSLSLSCFVALPPLRAGRRRKC